MATALLSLAVTILVERERKKKTDLKQIKLLKILQAKARPEFHRIPVNTADE